VEIFIRILKKIAAIQFLDHKDIINISIQNLVSDTKKNTGTSLKISVPVPTKENFSPDPGKKLNFGHETGTRTTL
jgi:hypothetical protein